MKIKLFTALIFVFMAIGNLMADDIPYRKSTEVWDVTEAYEGEWIVSPGEEPIGDEEVSNAPECDIYGVLSCYDGDQLRIDILLNHGISYEFTVWYAIIIYYSESIEYYTYYPSSDEFFYEMEIDGEIVESYQLGDNDLDYVTVTSSEGLESGAVAFIINKEDHITGVKGKNYYLTTAVASGFVNTNDKMQIADQTMLFDLEFEY